jgi:hypothetical protein
MSLQEQVTKSRGLPPRAGTPNDRLFNTFVSRLTKEQRQATRNRYRAKLALMAVGTDLAGVIRCRPPRRSTGEM